MAYPVNPSEVDRIAKGLEEYYSDAWHAGIKNVVGNMGRSQMGLASGYLDAAKDTWANFRKKSSDSFRVTFKSDLKQQMGLYFANKFDVAKDLVAVGEKVIDKLASMLPVPALGPVVTAVGGYAVGKLKDSAKGKITDELHERSITEADRMLAARSDAELQKMFANDKDAIEFIENSMKQYKTLTNYIGTIPGNITSFDDAITFPKSTFKVQQAASSLNVALWSIRQYVEAMQQRLVECQNVSTQYIATVRTKMPEVVTAVLRDAYQEGMNKGKMDVSGKKYTAPATPSAPPAKPGAGGATLLAAATAHALAQGYYDAGNTGPILAAAQKMPPQIRR